MPEIYFKPRHPGQRRVAEVWDETSALVLTGPAGTGKTACALALALMKSKRVMLCRPAVPVDEDLGFIPGDLNEKLAPWMGPFACVLRDLSVTGPTLEKWGKTIETVSIGLLAGLTVKDCTLIIDEAQSATYAQLKMALTRVGDRGRLVLCGDYEQPARPGLVGTNPLRDVANRLSSVSGAAVIHFIPEWQQRSPFVQRVLEVL